MMDELIDVEMIIVINEHTKIFKDIKVNKNSKIGFLSETVEEIL